MSVDPLSGPVEYSDAEREAIGLCIALEAVDDIANRALLELRDVGSATGECEVYFHSRVHEQLFLIRLLDFVGENGDKSLTGVSGSCLQVLEAACKTRSFESVGSTQPLDAATTALAAWLSLATPLHLWLPSLDLDVNLEVPRRVFLHVAGNQFKHNLSRLTRVSENIQQVLSDHGHTVAIEQIPFALDDFREHLQDDYFVYYGTWLAELLNNIRWGLQDYLEPAFRVSYSPDPEANGHYLYRYPADIVKDVPRSWFWRLMNNVRRGPLVKRFTGAHYLKKVRTRGSEVGRPR